MRDSKFTGIVDACLVILSFIIFVHSVLELKYSILVKQKMKYVFQNRYVNAIESVTLGRNVCEEGYEPMYNSTFHKIEGGIYNNETNKLDDTCHDGLACIHISEIPEQTTNVWQDKVICLKRTNFTDYDTKFVISSGSCPEGMRSCGYFNVFKDQYCLVNELECPLNYIDIRESKPLPLENLQFLELKLNKYLVFSNKKTEDIIPVDFQIAEDFPCLEQERFSYNTIQKIYPTSQNKEKYGCNRNADDYRNIIDPKDDGMDRRYEAIDSLSRSKFFKDNDLQNTYDKLPEIGEWKKNKKDDINYYLFKRTYISINYKCTDYDKILKFDVQLNQMKTTKYIQHIVSLANIVLVAFFLSMLSLVKVVRRSFYVVLSCLKITTGATFVIYNIVISEQSKSYTNYIIKQFDVWYKPECLDPNTIYSINRHGLRNQMEDINFYNQFLIIFCITYSVLVIFQICRLLYKIILRVKNIKKNHIGKSLLSKSKTFNEIETGMERNKK